MTKLIHFTMLDTVANRSLLNQCMDTPENLRKEFAEFWPDYVKWLNSLDFKRFASIE